MPAPCILTKFSTNLPRAVDLPLKCCKKNMNRRGVLESSNKIMSISENSTKMRLTELYKTGQGLLIKYSSKTRGREIILQISLKSSAVDLRFNWKTRLGSDIWRCLLVNQCQCNLKER